MALITLTTDFGLEDAYVGTVKGVILGLAPAATLVDLCHLVPPQDVRTASFLLDTAVRFFPPPAIHVVVVDPGVGGQRRPVALRMPHGTFVGPDNGVFSAVLAQAGLVAAGPPDDLALSALPPTVEAVHLNRPAFWLPSVSATFHGRDIFAPVAGHLARGTPLAAFGDPLPALHAYPVPRPSRRSDGALVAPVIHVDGFGNLITAATAADLAGRPADAVRIEVAGRSIPGLVHTYSAGSGLLALIGSSGHLEIALRDGNAAAELGLGRGGLVVIS
ncbi:MAG: SAM-dependent chlorinase/fluorinase [Chloroflexi bacterium]|nr:SAM-dependent chlorinase/fluorinase [Chloroflexota bacterium]